MIQVFKDWSGYALLVVTIVGSLVAGSMRFGSLEARMNNFETTNVVTLQKLDTIQGQLMRIEGRMERDDADARRRSGHALPY